MRFGGRGGGRVPRRALQDGKFARIVELCTGKDVLDCGAVGGVIESKSDAEATSHATLAKAARSCLGIDIWEAEVAKRQALGMNIVHGNVETMALGRQFDVIVAADLIEHLANPGRFLDRAREHLRDGGRLCLVTPNAWSLNNVLKYAFGREPGVHPEHTCWYDFVTLRQLLARHGFRPVEEYWQDYRSRGFVRLALALRPNLAAHLMLIAEKGPREGA
jgi:2-polyprenyl-3-methyl-5-hydroxy-6-metoxy-1,4-benzoquinol methylase